jgi:hypothetical protein
MQKESGEEGKREKEKEGAGGRRRVEDDEEEGKAWKGEREVRNRGE